MAGRLRTVTTGKLILMLCWRYGISMRIDSGSTVGITGDLDGAGTWPGTGSATKLGVLSALLHCARRMHLRSMLALSPCSRATRATEAPGCEQAAITFCLHALVYRLRFGARLTTLFSFMIGVRLKIGGHYRISCTSIQDGLAGRLRISSAYSDKSKFDASDPSPRNAPSMHSIVESVLRY